MTMTDLTPSDLRTSIDLSTEYLGLTLKNPLIPSSGPLTNNLDNIRQLEDAGASAIVLPSLFEEELIHEQEQMARFLHQQDIGHNEADTFLPLPDNYTSHLDKILALVSSCKHSLDIPVIGSVNGISPSGWIECALDLQQAGCDAIELNLYSVAADAKKTGSTVEDEFLQLVDILTNEVSIPVTVKLSSQFSSLSNFAQQLQHKGAEGVVCFNRFFQPDINLETLTLSPTLELSTPAESLLRIRWLALLKGQVELSLAATGGFHSHKEVIKALLAGADAVYLCSILIQSGPRVLTEILANLLSWMEEKEYNSIEQLKGSLSYHKAASPSVYARGNYLEVMDSYSPSKGVKV